MVEIKRHQKGQRTYTHWGHRVKEVKIVPDKKPGDQQPASSQPQTQQYQPGTAGQPGVQTVQFTAQPDQMSGRYTNFAIVNNTETEFTLDFFYRQPAGLVKKAGPAEQNKPDTAMVIRLISGPKHTKRLLNALADSVARYEKQYGVIKI